MIKNIAFDLGGVVLALSYEQAVRRFEEIGLKDARQRLDAFEQKGIFGDLESGRITTEDFRRELSLLVGISSGNEIMINPTHKAEILGTLEILLESIVNQVAPFSGFQEHETQRKLRIVLCLRQ